MDREVAHNHDIIRCHFQQLKQDGIDYKKMQKREDYHNAGTETIDSPVASPSGTIPVFFMSS